MILVTGVGGFIGYNSCLYLLSQGEQIIGIDDFSTGSKDLVQKLETDKNFNFKEMSILSVEDINDLFETWDIKSVLHLAALPRVNYSFDFPLSTNEVNIKGTLNLLYICQKEGVEKFVFSSSSSVYGNQETYPLVETMTPAPMSPYGIQKLTGEKYCKLFHKTYNFPVIMLRYFNVYGDTTSTINKYTCFLPKIINLVQNGNAPTIYGTGEQARDFTHISDICHGNYLALNTKNEKALGEVFNIGFGSPLSINTVFDEVRKAINENIKALTKQLEFEEPSITWANNDKAKALLGWEPKMAFADGLKNYIGLLVEKESGVV